MTVTSSKTHFILDSDGIKEDTMLTKLKRWIIGSVIMKKVIGKFAKHASGVLTGLLSAPLFVDKIQPYLDQLGITINEGQLEAGLVVVMTGLFGALWNFIEHRLLNK